MFDDLTSTSTWDKTTATVVQAARDEVQVVTLTGGPTGGSFTLSFGGQVTALIAYNATAATVQTALRALSTILANVLVTGGPGPGTPWTVEFISSLGFATQPMLLLNGNALTGGTAPSVAISEAQVGLPYTVVAGGFVINYAIGQVVFTSPFAGSVVNCRISTGAYFPSSFLANTKSADISIGVDVIDVTTFQNVSTPWKQKLGLMAGATVKISKYFADNQMAALITNATQLLVIIYTGANNNQRYVGYAKMKQDALKFAIGSAHAEDLDLEVDGQLYFIAS